jgi:hypothetical protein
MLSFKHLGQDCSQELLSRLFTVFKAAYTKTAYTLAVLEMLETDEILV